MKTKTFALLALLLAAFSVASAQQNIKSAFDAIIKSPDAKISRAHSLDKDPETGIKNGESDVYTFTLPASKMGLVKKVIAAFDKDDSKAYSIKSGKATRRDPKIELAVGENAGSGVYVNRPDYDYIYALFLAPQSQSHDNKFRYAYAFNYRENKDQIEGHIIITYATTLKYRQQSSRYNRGNRNIRVITNSGSTAKWFDEVMENVQAIPVVSQSTRINLASKIYSLVRNVKKYNDVTDSDKNTVREVLKVMISDPKYRSEEVLRKLLQQCLVEL